MANRRKQGEYQGVGGLMKLIDDMKLDKKEEMKNKFQSRFSIDFSLNRPIFKIF